MPNGTMETDPASVQQDPPASAEALGADVPVDRIDPHAALGQYNRTAASPTSTPDRAAATAAANQSIENNSQRESPGLFRKILEVLEFVARGFIPVLSQFINALSAALRILRLILRPPEDGDYSKEMTRLGLDLLGILVPWASAVGHLGLNAWWGATDATDTELLAGWDAHLHQMPIVGGLFEDQARQDVWLGGALRGVFNWTRETIDGEPTAQERQEVGDTTEIPEPPVFTGVNTALVF